MSEFQQTQKTIKYTVLPIKVDNKPSNNVAVMIGLLHVAFIEEQPDGKWKIKLLWEHALPHGSDLAWSKPEALSIVKQIIMG